ncbi:threonine aldolase, partial [Streptomyces sp. e14]
GRPRCTTSTRRPTCTAAGVVAALEEKVAGLLGKEAAVFFPTGTMAQQVALRCWAARTGNPAVALHALSHPEVHERHALSQVGGLRPVRVTGEPRLPTAAEVRGLDEPFGALMLELPLRDAGFLLPAWEELTEVVEAAREREAVVHFDGARLWESTVHFGRPLTEIADLADSVYVSFYKSLGGYGGAALAGPAELAEEARAWRHRYGGAVFQQFPTALSALIGLAEELPRLPEYVRHARVVAAALREGFAAAGLPWGAGAPRGPAHPRVPALAAVRTGRGREGGDPDGRGDRDDAVRRRLGTRRPGTGPHRGSPYARPAWSGRRTTYGRRVAEVHPPGWVEEAGRAGGA